MGGVPVLLGARFAALEGCAVAVLEVGRPVARAPKVTPAATP